MSGLKLPWSPEVQGALESHAQYYKELLPFEKRLNLQVRHEDPEAHTLISREPGGRFSLTLVLPVDDDGNPDNGRFYLKDTFVFDARGDKFLDWGREWENPSAADLTLKHWQPIVEQFKQTAVPNRSIAKALGLRLWEVNPRPVMASAEFGENIQISDPLRKHLIAIGESAQRADPGLRLRIYSPESYYSRWLDSDSGKIHTIHRWVLDHDLEPLNGRYFAEDHFIEDSSTGKLVGYDRKWLEGSGAWGRGVIPDRGSLSQDILEKLKKLPPPTLDQGRSFYQSVKKVYQEEIQLQRLAHYTGTLKDNEAFIGSLGASQYRFINQIPLDARVLTKNLTLKTQDPKTRYQIRFLGDRREFTFTWLVTDYDNPQNNRILCHDRFITSDNG
ncbi:MAG: hypothetical protein R3257_03695, partial [bacterium]|nr:hypothetical protein [bacterium]